MLGILKKLKQWAFDILGFLFFLLLEIFLYLTEIIDFFSKKIKKKETRCNPNT